VNPLSQEEVKEPSQKRLKKEELARKEPSYIDNLKLASFEPLDRLYRRAQCPQCKQSRKFFCYKCYLPLSDSVPHVDLPMNVTV